MADEASQRSWPRLRSLPAAELLDQLDLTRPELAAVAAAGNAERAWFALRQHLRRYWANGLNDEGSIPPREVSDPLAEAEDIIAHRFRSSEKGVMQFPTPMDWMQSDKGVSPSETINLVRFYWARTLAQAYQQKPDSRYVRSFLELAHSYFDRWPLSGSDPTDPAQTPVRWGWRDLQVSRRVRHLLEAMATFVHDDAMTPAELAWLLAIVHDHQTASVQWSKPSVGHNMAMAEQDAMSQVAAELPIFRDARPWMATALGRMLVSLQAQTTPDGVQTEWAGGYHMAVTRGGLSVAARALRLGMDVPAAILQRLEAMADYVLGVLSPDDDLPAFGDYKHTTDPGGRKEKLDVLRLAGRILAADRFKHRADQRWDQLPLPPSRCFHHAGAVVMRSHWGDDALCLYLHNPPAGGGFHDEPDNGTFELCHGGRWLMPDTGYYTYGGDPPKRAWHRQTRVHQTLTLNGADSASAGSVRLWRQEDGLETVVLDNPAYPGLLHRRTVWFVQRRCFVLLDEAIGDAAGEVAAHFQLAPGPWQRDAATCRAWTTSDAANILVQSFAAPPPAMVEEEGWYADGYAHRVPRPAWRCVMPPGCRLLVTVLLPFQGVPPSVDAAIDAGEQTPAILLTRDGGSLRLVRPSIVETSSIPH